ncbi:hypothetical protein [uncultured Marivita sp.]|uniref:hypothetical protein n=1 Tax=uncultured Marivita sp. TaxID=888080 RepID=UPI00262461FE|nr:hypothetical protein [uncultured Marivita sp.]
MIDDGLNLDSLSANSQEAFTEFESQIRTAYEKSMRDDRQHETDQNDNYIGSYAPERSYVMAVLAFLDEFGLETEIEDISELEGEEFYKQFRQFKSKIEYTTMRYKLRKSRIANGGVGTVIAIAATYKTEIGSLLEKIRKIVNQEVAAGNKKDKIFTKITALQSEVDRDLTTVDAAFGRVLDLSKMLGEAGGNIKPAVDQLERIKKLFWDRSEKVEQLPKPDRPKMITEEKPEGYQGYGESPRDLDDEIPF